MARPHENGDGTTIDYKTPVQVAINVSQVAAGYYHSLFFKIDDTFWGIGRNSYGQLGDGTTENRFTPVQIATDVSQATAGESHSLFLQLLDSDNDGLQDSLEENGCTDPLDADTDDDSILDETEDANRNGIVDIGETDPCDPDTDGDGLQDGTEIGLTLQTIEKDTDSSFFIPDSDPNTDTDPLDNDTDNDGIQDGNEDINHNGAVDIGETDPCDPDTDGDGLQDGTEIGLTLQMIEKDTDSSFFIPDSDPNTDTDPLDNDTDNDGKLDGDEDTNHNGSFDPGETNPLTYDVSSSGNTDEPENDSNKEGSSGSGGCFLSTIL